MPREKLVPLSEAKTKLFELVRDAQETDVLLLRHGRPAAVLIGADRYEKILDKLEDLADTIAIHEARAARASAKA